MRWLLWMVFLMTWLRPLASQPDDTERGLRGLRFMFYNAENLFDPFDDSLKIDEDFTFDGQKHWSWRRMQAKCGNIARVIIAAGGWEAVEMVGLCEVENPLVIRQLVKHPLLKPYGYRYLVTKSPDHRGINIAFLYRSEKVEVISNRSIRIINPADLSWATRDIFYIKMVTLFSDTLHLFLNHWPSRMGGEEVSSPKRALAATTLRHKVDSLGALPFPAYILISGDFNDEPSDSSVMWILGAAPPGDRTGSGLVNLMWPYFASGMGTHAHRDVTGMHYNLLDQIIVSEAMLHEKASIRAMDAMIGRFPFLMTENAAGEEIPYRTYAGPQYLGGFSDHLPVMVDLRLH